MSFIQVLEKRLYGAWVAAGDRFLENRNKEVNNIVMSKS